MKKERPEYRMSMEHQRTKSPDPKLLTGSLKGMYPITLDGGRTTIFIADPSRESEIRERYELRMGNRIMVVPKKPKV
jgi:hypothetical protein